MEARDRLLRRSSWLPLLARLALLGTLPRLTGGRPVVCMGVFYVFTRAPIVVLPFLYSSLRSSAGRRRDGAAPHKLAAHRDLYRVPVRRRRSTARRVRPKAKAT